MSKAGRSMPPACDQVQGGGVRRSGSCSVLLAFMVWLQDAGTGRQVLSFVTSMMASGDTTPCTTVGRKTFFLNHRRVGFLYCRDFSGTCADMAWISRRIHGVGLGNMSILASRSFFWG